MAVLHDRHRMSLADFLAWEEGQPEKWELVDGEPIPRGARMMAGGTRRHARMAGNIGAAINTRLRRRECFAYGSDLKVEAATGNIRYPDVTIDCGGAGDSSLFAADPRAIIEVLSPSNRPFELAELTLDYQSIATVIQIVFVSQDAPQAQVWTRGGDGGWSVRVLNGADAVLVIPAFDLDLPFSEIYDGVAFEPDQWADPGAI